MSQPNPAKRAAAFAAADLVPTGATIGLGSGSTFAFVLERLAERMQKDGFTVRGVPSSIATADIAKRLGVPLVSLDEVERLDLTIDGADEVDPRKNLIKGGGGAHVRERIVAEAAKEMIVVIDEQKLVDVLGKAFLLPVEVLPFGWMQTARAIAATGCTTKRREGADQKPYVTDNGNWILDCKYAGIDDPALLDAQLGGLTGVVDHGLFVGIAGRIVVGNADGKVRILP